MAWANDTAIAMTGSEVEYEAPDGACVVILKPVGGDITLAFTSGGNTYPVENRTVWQVPDANLSKQKFYLVGAVGVTVYPQYSTHRLEQ